MAGEAEADTLSTVVAPAKLTVSLRVMGQRADGYHLIDAEMVGLDLADELTFAAPLVAEGVARSSTLEIVGSGPAEASAGKVPSGEGNLVVKALDAVGRPAHVRLVKRIPPGAGLGGGSTDAAAVLRWAGRVRDTELAASLGADVPFCLRGGRARVTGIGDVLDPLPFEERVYTLSMPPFGCSTPAVYRAFDELAGSTPTPPPEGAGDDGAANDLQAAALVVEPRLADWRHALAEATGQVPRLAGSGSTWFVEGAFPGEERVVARTVPAFW